MFGWAGALLFIIAYLFLLLEIFSAENKMYHIFNALGAICLLVNALYIGDTPNLVVNFVWLVIAIISIFKIILKKNKNSKVS
jgi:membrane-bound ClpP family serine protease